ncbi:MAG TPA: transglycosylase SLT domain-containing protein, partial [Nocardioides sp.]|nr:transglycosylase SLT domain-containing protein [Nocardioides sp.]
MSIDQVTSRIAQIQSQLSQLYPTATSTDFASTLAATGTPDTGVAGAARMVAGGTVGGADVVADAKKYLGVPYVWGGTDPLKGMDCSAFVQRVYGDLGYSLPRVSSEQATKGTAVASLAEAQAGDILAFGSPVHHVAIYLGGGKMIEEPHTGSECRISDVYETPTHIRRILGSVAPDAASSPTAATSTPGIAARVSTAIPYADLMNAASARTGVPAELIAAVAKQESGFNARAVSPVGAQGLMQLMPGTARGLGVTNSFDPAQAIDGGARLLKSLLTKFDGRVDLALAGYNAGAGAVQRYDGVPPYRETQNYVKDIMAMLQNGVAA